MSTAIHRSLGFRFLGTAGVKPPEEGEDKGSEY